MTTEMIISSLTKGQNNSIQYVERINAFINTGYTSLAGNHYFNMLRFAEGILIKEDVGEGYLHTFLNGIRVYSIKDRCLIADASFHNVIYSQETVKRQVKSMLLGILDEASKTQGFGYNLSEAKSIITKIIADAFELDQRNMARDQMKRLSS